MCENGQITLPSKKRDPTLWHNGLKDAVGFRPQRELL